MAANLFYFLCFLALFSALMVVISRSPVQSVLYLILTFFSLSGHYVLLNAQFLAAVNLIVYAGAIMVLFLFVIMFLNLRAGELNEARTPLLSKLAGVLSAGLLLVIFTGVVKEYEAGPAKVEGFKAGVGLVEGLGQTLFTKFLVPFELASVLFLAAMVGAVMIGRREPGERNAF